MVSKVLTGLFAAIDWLLTGAAESVRRDVTVRGTRRFPRRLQVDGWSCGARSAQAIMKHFGRDVSYGDVVAGVRMTTDGTAATPIVRFLRQYGLRAGYHRRMSYKQLRRALERGGVVLVDLDGTHWSVAHAISDAHVWLANPSTKQFGRRVTRSSFRSRWTRLGVIVTENPRASTLGQTKR